LIALVALLFGGLLLHAGGFPAILTEIFVFPLPDNDQPLSGSAADDHTFSGACRTASTNSRTADFLPI
jgi:hypothetical protein